MVSTSLTAAAASNRRAHGSTRAREDTRFEGGYVLTASSVVKGSSFESDVLFFSCAVPCCIERTKTPIHSPSLGNDALSKSEDSRSRRFFSGGILKIAFSVRIPSGQLSR